MDPQRTLKVILISFPIFMVLYAISFVPLLTGFVFSTTKTSPSGDDMIEFNPLLTPGLVFFYGLPGMILTIIVWYVVSVILSMLILKMGRWLRDRSMKRASH